jgi:uncharacterized RDD family membrane protein YckC
MPGVGYGIAHSKPTDVLGRRIGAYAIDVGIGLVIFFVMFFALASTQSFDTARQATAFCDQLNDDPDMLCTASGTSTYVIDSTELGAIMLALSGYLIVNFVLLTGLTGFSLGKVMTGVRVVNQHTGHRCGIGRALLRTVLLVVPDIGGLVGVIVAATNSERRRVGDMAAGTLVVHKRALGQPPLQPTGAPYVYTPGYPSGYPPGYGYPAPPSWPAPGTQAPAPPWPAPATPAPPPPWAAPTPPPPQPATPAVEPWPDFGRPPADPDATTVFDTTSPTDRHHVVDDERADPARDRPGAPREPAEAAPTVATSTPRPSPAPTHPEAKPPSAEPVATAPSTDPATKTAATEAGAQASATPRATEPSESTPGVGAPHWDTKRNTYIQWDPDLSAWMQWDYAKNEWQPMREPL